MLRVTLGRLTAIGVFLAALAPSAYLAWTLRTMPHLGFYHDDSIYWVSGRSLAMGEGYRIESLPGQPYQTKYPPLYCALLAGIWKLDPQFPSNLPMATLFAWLLLPLFLGVLWFLLHEYGFSMRARCVMVLAAGLSPVTVVFSFSLMPELLFTALLLASLILAERAGRPSSIRAIRASLLGEPEVWCRPDMSPPSEGRSRRALSSSRRRAAVFLPTPGTWQRASASSSSTAVDSDAGDIDDRMAKANEGPTP